MYVIYTNEGAIYIYSDIGIVGSIIDLHKHIHTILKDMET